MAEDILTMNAENDQPPWGVQTWTASAGNKWDCVAATGGGYISQISDWAYQGFESTACDASSGQTINSIILHAEAKTDNDTDAMVLLINDHTNFDAGSSQALTTSYVDKSEEWITDPFNGDIAWTSAEVDDLCYFIQTQNISDIMYADKMWTVVDYTAAAGEDVNVSAGTKSLTLTTNQSDVNAETEVDAASVSLSLTTYQAEIGLNVAVSAGVEELSLTTYQSDVNAESEVEAGVSTLSVATYSATVSLDADIDVNVDVGVENLNLATYQSDVNAEAEVEVGTVGLNLSTQQANVNAENEVEAGVSSLSLTTQQADVSLNNPVSVGVSELSLATNQTDVNAENEVDAGTVGLTLDTHKASVSLVVAGLSQAKRLLTLGVGM